MAMGKLIKLNFPKKLLRGASLPKVNTAKITEKNQPIKASRDIINPQKIGLLDIINLTLEYRFHISWPKQGRCLHRNETWC